MRIMTVLTLYVPARVDRILGRIMNAGRFKYWVCADFIEFALYVFGRNVSAVTRKAILFLISKVKQPRPDPGAVRGVSVFASVRGNARGFGVGPGIDAHTIPGLVGEAMA